MLIFDYELQDNRFSPERLEEMQRYFNESTDNGKLYVNYPMVEACKHFLKMPDVEYLNRTVSREDVLKYKSIVGNASRYQSFERHFIRPDVDEMIVLTAIKALRLCGHNGEAGYESEYRDLDHETMLRRKTILCVWLMRYGFLIPACYLFWITQRVLLISRESSRSYLARFLDATTPA